MNEPSVIAADLGTTGVKAALVHRSGRIGASAYRGYPTSGSGSMVEQDPEDWWRALAAALAEIAGTLAGKRPEALVLSGQMQDLIMVGGTGRSPAILYSDARAQAEATEVARLHGGQRHALEARNDQDATGLAAKLLWVSHNLPASMASAGRVFFGAHDYAAWRLCGAAVTDLTTASTTGLLLFDEGSWNLPLLEALGLRSDWLPTLVPAQSVVGSLSAAAALETGLPEGLPLIHGAGDAATSTLGSRAGVEGRLSVNLGTSGWVALTSGGAPADPATGAFNLRHPDASRLILVGPMLTAAGNLDWLRSALSAETERAEAFEAMTRAAAESRPGSGGLLYLPWLAGERSPFRDPEARAAFIGISRETSRGDLARGAMEGVALSLRSVHRALGGPGAAATEAVAVGGGARSPLWCRILATMLGCAVSVPEKPDEAGLRGAALLAGLELGWFSSYDPGPGFLPLAATYAPEPDWEEGYAALAEIHEGLHTALAPSFAALARLRAGRGGKDTIS